MKKIIIVGAGTIGLHSAFYLADKGYEVEVLDSAAAEDVKGCSYGNCGFIVPSHFTPLASPAMLHSGLKMLLDRKSPVHLPLLRSIDKLPFYTRMAISSNKKHVNRVQGLLYKLNTQSGSLYQDLNRLSGGKTELRENGLIIGSTSHAGYKEELELAEVASELGIDIEILDIQGLERLEPGLKAELTGAVHYKSDALIHPVKHMQWLKNYLKKQGVVFHFDTKVQSVSISKGKVTGIVAGEKKYSGDVYLFAAGLSTSSLLKYVDIKLPLIAGKGYSIDLPRRDFQLDTPLILSEARVALTPFKDSLRIGSGMEFSGKLGELHYRRIQAMLDRTREALPDFPEADARKSRIWEGMRPVSPDGVPFIGYNTKYPELLVATGHAMMGVSLGPISGKIISDMVEGKETGFDMGLLSPERFN